MKRINQAGWKNYFFTDAPRIAKEDNIKHLSKSRDVIDPSYIFSFEEWKNIINNSPTKSLGYRLYANGIILDISLKRTAKNKCNEEQYMLRFSFQSVRYNERDSIPDSDKMTPSEFEQAFKKRLIENKNIGKRRREKLRLRAIISMKNIQILMFGHMLNRSFKIIKGLIYLNLSLLNNSIFSFHSKSIV